MDIIHFSDTIYDSLSTDIDSYIEYLVITYPDICQTEVIGKSSQGRYLKLLKVSTGGDSNKPAIWIDGGKHNKTGSVNITMRNIQVTTAVVKKQ
jgi:Zinc carboxypeptidase.